MRIRSGLIILLFMVIVGIDVFFKPGDWWFSAKIFMVWGAILFDAFADMNASKNYKISLLISIMVFLGIIQWTVATFLF